MHKQRLQSSLELHALLLNQIQLQRRSDMNKVGSSISPTMLMKPLTRCLLHQRSGLGHLLVLLVTLLIYGNASLNEMYLFTLVVIKRPYTIHSKEVTSLLASPSMKLRTLCTSNPMCSKRWFRIHSVGM